MCLYHYLYFSSCQHGELSQITYCDKAKALGLAEHVSLSQRSFGAGIYQNNQPDTSSTLSQPPASSSASNHSASHSHSQQQHCNMATLSPSKARTSFGCSPTSINQEPPSPRRAALVPRSVLPESNYQGLTHGTSYTLSSSAVQAFHALKNQIAHDSALSMSVGNSRQGSHHEMASTSSTTSAHRTCESDVETLQGSSEASVDNIAEQGTINYGNVKSASPRKPLPAQWLPTSSPTHPTMQRAKFHESTKSPTSGSSIEHKTVRMSRGSFDASKAHAGGATFLTKDTLDAVDADISSPTLRRIPSKLQRSPAKVPWNSPTVSPKVGSLRHSAASPTKPSPPRTKRLSFHGASDHKYAPSSMTSTGSTSFHTANSSPVRNYAITMASLSSVEDNDNMSSQSLGAVANMNFEQAETSNGKPKVSPSRATIGLRVRVSRPELSISIPPPDSTFDADQGSASTLASATSSTEVSICQGNSPVSASQSSRIPRMSISKGSRAHAPTLSSTLKQTKSTQTLRSPKAPKRANEADRSNVSRATGTKSLRHVRTVDSLGSTPILSDRKSHDSSIPASIAGAAGATATAIERTAHAPDVDLLTSYLRNTALDTRRVIKPAQATNASSTTSRATSTSTVRATRAVDDPASTDSAVIYSRKQPHDSGGLHSSDADDEYDGSTTSAPGPDDDVQNISPVRGRSAEYNPSIRRATVSEVSVQSSLASDLRATAPEFVPGRSDTTAENDTAGQTGALPDMYALDGYGIPWFYHMYPAPWLFPPIYTTNHRFKSPKKFRHKKQRSTVNSPIENKQAQDEALPSIEMQINADSVDTSARQSERSNESVDNPPLQKSTAASSDSCVLGATSDVKSSEGPFATQFDMIARQTALQTSTNSTPAPHVDLTNIRNVPTHDPVRQSHAHGYNTVPSRRQNHRQAGNGLYGGRGNIGVPLYATAPFPDPVPPMGRPIEHCGKDSKADVGYNIGTNSCGTIEIEKAAEHGGEQSCNTCEPDH